VKRGLTTLVALAVGVLTSTLALSAETDDIGRTATNATINARVIDATLASAPTVVLLGGIEGDGTSTIAVRQVVDAYAKRRVRPIRLLAVALANPVRVAMRFPPTGVAYREQFEAHALWRWLASQAPDLVMIAGSVDAGLIAALATQPIADTGTIPARLWDANTAWDAGLATLAKSPARQEMERRRARTARQFADEMARVYGHEFEQPWYIGALALVARAQLGELADVRRLVEPWVDGSKDSLTRPNALVMAGHVIFTELARQTGDPRYVAAVRKVAQMGFDDQGQMRDAMPYHDRYSDSVFMGTTIAAQAGALTGESSYFDLADRHLRFMQNLVLRPDGLYRHRSDVDVPWGRGNGFAAIGLALTLSEIPRNHPSRAHALKSYQALMNTLLPFQNLDGLWRNVVNHPGAFPEVSGTAMIGFALQRGLNKGWIKGRRYQQAADQAWMALLARTSSSGQFIDVCESTANLTTLEQYLTRAAILGVDARGGAMALQFAMERMAKRATRR
jgi:unsaturated rhamnogalacturonyl hydrolase